VALTALVAAAIVLVVTAGCGREESPDLSNGKSQFVEHCGSCHTLARAGTQGETAPNLDEAFLAALQDGMDRDTVEGIVHDQIGNVRRGSEMPEDLVKGTDARDVAAYVAFAAGKKGEDGGALAQAGLAGATSGEQIYAAAGCGSCHTLGKAGTTSSTGPSLDDLASAAGEREPGTSAEDYVHQSLVDPDAFVVEGFQAGVMPSFEGRLSEKQIQALTEYLLGN
jgi:mono/diheme cytochrome c family protein